jgi:queuine tRNA-ribosyltransferase
MPHDLVVFPNGSVSVKPRSSNEAMHSTIGPWDEAHLIYIGQSDLAGRLQAPSAEGGPLVLYDVGMGIAANALAALECWANAGSSRRDLHLVSFEKHLDGLELALAHSDRFPFIARHMEALNHLLKKGAWENVSPGGANARWEIHSGDFLAKDLGNLPSPEIIFFDFYSPKANPELWGVRCFEKLARACEPRRASGLGSLLLTYCAATSARAAMLLSGFCVGTGTPTGVKLETTMASTRLEDLPRPLQPSWLQKLERSDKPLPADWNPALRNEALERIRSHRQFQP